MKKEGLTDGFKKAEERMEEVGAKARRALKIQNRYHIALGGAALVMVGFAIAAVTTLYKPWMMASDLMTVVMWILLLLAERKRSEVRYWLGHMDGSIAALEMQREILLEEKERVEKELADKQKADAAAKVPAEGDQGKA